jgi:hypothetical protein
MKNLKEFKEKDLVLIFKKVTKDAPFWSDLMDSTLGQIGVIVSSSKFDKTCFVKVKKDMFWYNKKCLVKLLELSVKYIL